jgi:predicted nucleic acid-binding protein
MRADAPREFVDANLLVYAFDTSAGDKKARAEALLARLWAAQSGCLSVQVLQEFFVVVTAKVPRPLSVPAAAERIREFASWLVFAPTAADVLDAIRLQQEAKLSFWDAMIVHAAVESGAETLWSEDFRNGQTIRGVRIRDPFAD